MELHSSCGPLGAQTLVRVYLMHKLTDAERKVEEMSDFFASATSNSSDASRAGLSL